MSISQTRHAARPRPSSVNPRSSSRTPRGTRQPRRGRGAREVGEGDGGLASSEAARTRPAGGCRRPDGSVPRMPRPRGRAAARRGDRGGDPRPPPLVPATTPSTSPPSVRDFRRAGRPTASASPTSSTRSLAFQPQQHRVDGLRHPRRLPDVHPERVSATGAWRQLSWSRSSGPSSSRELEADYTNTLFVLAAVRRLHAGLRHQLGACSSPRRSRCARSRPSRGARSSRTARPRATAGVVRAAADIEREARPARGCRAACSTTRRSPRRPSCMWDLIHDRTHMRGDLPFDPFMIKQRMPYFLYSLEELRCDLTRVPRGVAIAERLRARQDDLSPVEQETLRRPARAVRRDLRPHLPVRDHRVRVRATTTASAGSCCSPGCTSRHVAALDGHVAGVRLGRGAGRGRRAGRGDRRAATGAPSTGPRPRTGSPRTSSCARR